MTFRRPAAHLQKAPGRRRSGDESCWESLISEGELVPHVPGPPRTRRPQSATEAGQLDKWLKHLQVMRGDPLGAPAPDHVPGVTARSASMTTLDNEQTGRTWRHQGIPPCRRGSSSNGTPSLCGSSFGSQDSLVTGVSSSSERRGSCERVHIIQTARKEHTQVSCLTPVKTRWLPIQRKVMTAAELNLDQSVGQVKLKQSITPTFLQNRVTATVQGGEVEGSHTNSSTLAVKTSQTNDQVAAQVSEKQHFPAQEGSRPVCWQALRRGWNSVRESAFPGCSRSIELPTGNPDPNRKSPQMKTTSVEPLKCTPLHGTKYTEPCRPHTLLQGTNSTEAHRSNTSLHRTSRIQPIKATAPVQIQTNSAVTTLIPQNKASFSSITISSRKVSRSASLPGSNTHSPLSQSSRPPSPLLTQQSMDQTSRHVTMQRKATIVKVTEQRVMSSPVPSTQRVGPPTAGNHLDTVVHRRKATIIKVTEHRESYSPANVGSRMRHPEYRHSYTEGGFKDNDTWSRENHSQPIAAPIYHNLDSTKRTDPCVASNTSTTHPGKDGGSLHRSTLSLFVSNPPATAAPAPSEVSPNAVGHRSDRPPRPLSCYGNLFGHTEPSKENVTHQPARKWSLGLPQEPNINPMNSISPGTAVKGAGQQVAHTLKPNRDKGERLPAPEDLTRRASTSLTLIQAPDPNSHQSPEQVLALNAAAVIANIKLQRQLSKKKTSNGNSAKDSTAPPLQGNTVTDMRKTQLDQVPVRHHSTPHAAFVPLSPEPETSPEMVSLQEALQKSKPNFIHRSQGRVQELERRVQERREKACSVAPQTRAVLKQRAHRVQPSSLNDNLVRPGDRGFTGKEMYLGSKRKLAEARRKKDGERNREVCLSNRQRVELFKKKLLDQILQRGNN
ncbi:(E2-independent) E3 ubiquitin-conjugating enzyme FATS [Solea solea]|uniref:(E2-independent) E3 ubiquitin-conjugating enzyme FATS n=1 Tax=Solea solea TaxID=90069 RepID=UPI00272AEE4D|nr:(E2-independent) E3 ubiquitin-conjugating enzyme FATS [Solea solea]